HFGSHRTGQGRAPAFGVEPDPRRAVDAAGADRRPHGVHPADLRAEHWQLLLADRHRHLQPLRLRAERLDWRLDTVLLGLVAGLVALRRAVHRAHFPGPHDPRIRHWRATGAN